MENKKTPEEPLVYTHAKLRNDIFTAIKNIAANYQFPLFLIEGVLTSILLDIRSDSSESLVTETSTYVDRLKRELESESETNGG